MDHKLIILLVVGLAQYSLACSGCSYDVDAKDPEETKFLTSILSQKLPKGTENEHIKLVEINQATSRVINGYVRTYDIDAVGVKTYKPYSCHLVILDQAHIGVIEFQEYSCKPSENRNKRSIPGGEYEINLNEKNGELLEYKKMVSEELNKQQKSKYLMGVVNVLKATRQVVSGFLTKLAVEVAETDCLSGSTASQKKCSFQEKNHKICLVEIWEQPWAQKNKVTKLECNLNSQIVQTLAVTAPRRPYFCAGCPIELTPEDEVANQCLKRTLFNLNSQAESKHFNLLQITKVTTQVVAGVKYNIEFEAEDQAHATYICRTEILLQPWITQEPSVVDFECIPLAKK